MDALSEIEDMLMRLEALLEEEKRHHEMLKNYLLTHSASVEEVVEVDYKVGEPDLVRGSVLTVNIVVNA